MPKKFFPTQKEKFTFYCYLALNNFVATTKLRFRIPFKLFKKVLLEKIINVNGIFLTKVNVFTMVLTQVLSKTFIFPTKVNVFIMVLTQVLSKTFIFPGHI